MLARARALRASPRFVPSNPSSHSAGATQTRRRRAFPTFSAMAKSETQSSSAEYRRAKVAVIGAGAAGLGAARELKREGHTVVVFEQGKDVGGVWVYDENVETDKLGIQVNRKKVHSSVYASLRTNLPREVMGYGSFPFTKGFSGKDNRRFCGHKEVRAYLDAYADHYELRALIKTNTKVVSAEPTSEMDPDYLVAPPGYDYPKWGPRWGITTTDSDTDTETKKEIFDAVVVCNGHYSEPRVPELPNADKSPITQMHSHNYRVPDDDLFVGKKVVVLGASASGEDLSREIASVAQTVILSATGWKEDCDKKEFPAESHPDNMRRTGGIVEFGSTSNSVTFENDVTEQDVDVVVYATGYKVTFPFFLSGDGEGESNNVSSKTDASKSEKIIPTSTDNKVVPLWDHVFSPFAGPSLSFIGLPWKVVPFPQFEVQGRWISQAISGKVTLPDRDEMMHSVEKEILLDKNNHILDRHFHRMGNAQFEYNDRLLERCGEGPMPQWRQEMYLKTGQRKRSEPTSYRDGPTPWSDESSRFEARAEATDLGFENEPLDDEVFTEVVTTSS